MKRVQCGNIGRKDEEEELEKLAEFEEDAPLDEEEDMEEEEVIQKENNLLFNVQTHSVLAKKQKNVNVVKIHNIMAYANLNCDLNLDRICQHFGNAVYNPEEFHCTRIEVRTKRNTIITVSIFSNGKMLATGGDSLGNTHRAMKKIARKLKRPPLCYDVKFSKFGVSNSLFTYNTGYPINLNLMQKLCRGADYEPERFPALRLRLNTPPSSSLQGDYSTNNSSGGNSSSSAFGIATNEEASPASLSLPGFQMEECWLVHSQHRANKYSTEKQGGGKMSNINKECVTINVFSTGKITFTGVKKLYNIEYAFNYILPFLKKCEAKVFLPSHNKSI